MKSKFVRFKKIQSYLRRQSLPVSISEVHQALVNNLGLDVSRKTVERDFNELLDLGRVFILPGIPAKFSLLSPSEIEITLKLDEAEHILQILDKESELAKKIRSSLS